MAQLKEARSALSDVGQGKERKLALTKEERSDMVQRVKELEPSVIPLDENQLPTLVGKKLQQAPHAYIDSLNKDLYLALYKMPFFFSGAVSRMLEPKYRKRYPNPRKRYEEIKKHFCSQYSEIYVIPITYEYTILKTCLSLD